MDARALTVLHAMFQYWEAYTVLQQHCLGLVVKLASVSQVDDKKPSLPLVQRHFVAASMD